MSLIVAVAEIQGDGKRSGEIRAVAWELAAAARKLGKLAGASDIQILVPGEHPAEAAAEIAGKMSSLDTLEGGKVKVNSAGRITKVNKAAITQPDIMASNGVIHVIDKVILPE